MNQLSPQRTTSAGGVVFRRTCSTPKILVGERTTAVDPKWGGNSVTAKGAVGFGETLEQAALREVPQNRLPRYHQTKVGVASWCYERGGCQWSKSTLLLMIQSDIPEERDGEFEYVTWMSFRKRRQTFVSGREGNFARVCAKPDEVDRGDR